MGLKQPFLYNLYNLYKIKYTVLVEVHRFICLAVLHHHVAQMHHSINKCYFTSDMFHKSH